MVIGLKEWGKNCIEIYEKEDELPHITWIRRQYRIIKYEDFYCLVEDIYDKRTWSRSGRNEIFTSLEDARKKMKEIGLYVVISQDFKEVLLDGRGTLNADRSEGK